MTKSGDFISLRVHSEVGVGDSKKVVWLFRSCLSKGKVYRKWQKHMSLGRSMCRDRKRKMMKYFFLMVLFVTTGLFCGVAGCEARLDCPEFSAEITGKDVWLCTSHDIERSVFKLKTRLSLFHYLGLY